MGREQHGGLERKACVILVKCDTWGEFYIIKKDDKLSGGRVCAAASGYFETNKHDAFC